MIRFHVDGIPTAQPRVRPSLRGGRLGVFAPDDAKVWRQLVALAAAPHCPASPIDAPMRVRIDCFMERPKKLHRKKDPRGPLPCPTRPDCDNLAKSTLDSLTQLGWWTDDARVVELHVTKQYHAIGGRPGALITIEELTPAKEPASEPHTGARRSDTPAMTRGLRRPRSNGEVLGPAAASSFTPPALGVDPSED